MNNITRGVIYRSVEASTMYFKWFVSFPVYKRTLSRFDLASSEYTTMVITRPYIRHSRLSMDITDFIKVDCDWYYYS